MKREKLCLLSRFLTSPSNPRISGGYFFLHHGGSSLLLEGSLPLRNEGPLLPHGGFAPLPPPPLLHRRSVNDFVPHPYPPTKIHPPICPPILSMIVASNHHHHNLSSVVSASPISVVVRPPPKPSWQCLCLPMLVLNHVSGCFVFLQISLLIVNLGSALYVFEKMPHKYSVLLNLLLSALWRFLVIVKTLWLTTIARILPAIIRFLNSWKNQLILRPTIVDRPL